MPRIYGPAWKTTRMTAGKQKAMQAQVYKAVGLSNNEIAKRLGVTRTYVLELLAKAQASGMKAVRAAEDVVDEVALPLAVDNLVTGLKQGDRDFTLETLKGRGVFRKQDGSPAPMDIPALAIKIEAPDGTVATAITGTIVGVPDA